MIPGNTTSCHLLLSHTQPATNTTEHRGEWALHAENETPNRCSLGTYYNTVTASSLLFFLLFSFPICGLIHEINSCQKAGPIKQPEVQLTKDQLIEDKHWCLTTFGSEEQCEELFCRNKYPFRVGCTCRAASYDLP